MKLLVVDYRVCQATLFLIESSI